MKILKCKKALSPVVASIILIAVTVAVSIAVAAWMGALTFTFMGTEQVEIRNIAFSSGTLATLTIKNTGTSPVTISEVWVNNVKKTSGVSPVPPQSISANGDLTLNVTGTYIAGNNYEFKLITGKGNTFLRVGQPPST